MTALRTVVLASAATVISMAAGTPAAALPNNCTVKTTCVTHPGFVQGAKRGDILFKKGVSQSPGSITSLLNALGLTRTHSGMMLDGNRARHDSMTKAYLMTQVVRPCNSGDSVADAICVGAVTAAGGNIGMDTSISPTALKSGLPGLHTWSAVNEIDDDGGWEWDSSNTFLFSALDATRASRAADQLELIGKYPDFVGYSLYAFSQLDAAYARDHATMCSGAVFLAWRQAEMAAGGFSLVPQDIPTRTNDANIVYQGLLSTLVPKDIETFTDYEMQFAGPRIAAQITNAMAFGVFNEFDSNFASHMGTGLSIAGDNFVSEMSVGCHQVAYLVNGRTVWRTLCYQSPTGAYPMGGDSPATLVRDTQTCTTYTTCL